MVRFTFSQSFMSFGSKTTHWVPWRMVVSIMLNSRRTLRYRHDRSDDSVRAPHTRMPRTPKGRMQLTPIGFSSDCSPWVIFRVSQWQGGASVE